MRTNFKDKFLLTFRQNFDYFKHTFKHQIYDASIVCTLSPSPNICFQQDKYSCLWKTISKFWYNYPIFNELISLSNFKYSRFKQINVNWMFIVPKHHQSQLIINQLQDELITNLNASMLIWCCESQVFTRRNIPCSLWISDFEHKMHIFHVSNLTSNDLYIYSLKLDCSSIDRTFE